MIFQPLKNDCVQFSIVYDFLGLFGFVDGHNQVRIRSCARPVLSIPEATKPIPQPNETLQCQEQQCQFHGIHISYLSSRRGRANAGTILHRCLSAVDSFRDRMGRRLCVFKLGLTANPITRFEFYKEANYTHMALLHVSDQLGVAQMLEAALIAFHLSTHECRNERFGGEGPPTEGEPFHFVYVVGARADRMKPIR